MDVSSIKTGIKTQLKRGSVIDVDLGKPPQEVKGHEQGFERPCYVVKVLNALELAIVLPITSTELNNNYYTIVRVAAGTGGLELDSCVLCHQIRTISFDRIKGSRGALDDNTKAKIEAILLDMLEFDE